MAIVDENIRGKIGNSVFYRVGVVTRVRSAATSYTDANTTKQQENRSRLRVAIRFIDVWWRSGYRRRGIWRLKEPEKVGTISF